MAITTSTDSPSIVASVCAAARVHAASWNGLVPDSFTVNLVHEAEEERAYAEMAAAKAGLRAHICEVYGLSIRELASLALP